MTILRNDSSALILHHNFSLLVLRQCTGADDRVGLPIMQRVSSLGAIGLHRPTPLCAWLNCHLWPACHGLSFRFVATIASKADTARRNVRLDSRCRLAFLGYGASAGGRSGASSSSRLSSRRGPTRPTDPTCDLAPLESEVVKAPRASATTKSVRQPIKRNWTSAGTFATDAAATPPEPSNAVSRTTSNSRNISRLPFYSPTNLWPMLRRTAWTKHQPASEYDVGVSGLPPGRSPSRAFLRRADGQTVGAGRRRPEGPVRRGGDPVARGSEPREDHSEAEHVDGVQQESVHGPGDDG